MERHCNEGGVLDLRVEAFSSVGVDRGVLAGDTRAPRITEHPVSAAGLRTDPMTLRCQADGRPAPNVTWTKDGKALEVELQGGFSHRVVLPGGNLFFLRLDPADAGAYRCVADNGVGDPAVSREATLEVAYLKHEFRAAPTSQMVTAGDTVLLQCGPPRGRPDPAVQWRKDGRRLDVDEHGQHGDRQPRLRLVDGTNLAIRDARPADSGRYQCVAQNVAATRESPEASLQVAVPPHFVTRPSDTTALLGSSAVLRCEVAGDPKPSVNA
ncbi:roundabout homolog 2-like [Thrips palmi]|uniref:Roundabout homolog 2-like n=1 Tax=Thrips palmi TaxID=161013 RepID=A0A6P9A3R3_THRPL|nr:roundabout homolog 2-like [Thrips palmi]